MTIKYIFPIVHRVAKQRNQSNKRDAPKVEGLEAADCTAGFFKSLWPKIKLALKHFRPDERKLV